MVAAIWILFMGTLECARVVEVLLRLTDGSLPAPPFDLVMARAERCTFRDKSGVLVTPLQQQPSHYHIHLDCARAVILFHFSTSCASRFSTKTYHSSCTSNCFLD